MVSIDDNRKAELESYCELIHYLTLAIYFSLYFVKEGRTEVGNSHRYSFLYAVRQIVDGEIDADRLDYTLRDCHETGSKIGSFDLQN